MTDVYADADELWAIVGPGNALPDAQEPRLALALIAATRWVGYRVGVEVTDDELLAPYTIEAVECRPAWKAACLAAAVRFMKSADAPFGVTGVGEYGMSVKTSIPEAEVLLFGQREAFGFA